MRKYLFFILTFALTVVSISSLALAETPQQCTTQLENTLAISGGFGSLAGNLKLIEDTEEKCYPPEIDNEDQCIQRVNSYGWDSLTQTFPSGISQIDSTKEDLILNCSFKFISTNVTLETQGACSSHLGVNCQIGEDNDGSVICNDGYSGSGVLYALVEECKENSSLGSIVMPNYSVDLPTVSSGNIISNMKEELNSFHDLNLKTINLMYDALKIFGDFYLEIGRLSFELEGLVKDEPNDGTIFNQLLDSLSDLDKRYSTMRDAAIDNITALKTNLLNVRNNLKYIKGDLYVVTAINDVQETEDSYLEKIEKSTSNWNQRKIDSKAYIEKKRNNYFESQKIIVSEAIDPSPTIIFTDVGNAHLQATAIRHLKEQGIIQGYADGSFKSESTVNRAELMKILIGDSLPSGTYENCFKDVHQEWFAPYICYGKGQGWVNGYEDDTFKPSQTVNRAEAIKMAIEVFDIELPETVEIDPYTDTDKDIWFAPYVSIAKSKNLLSVNTHYQPSNGMTRGDISDIIYRLLTLKELQELKYDTSLDMRMTDY